MTEHNSQGGDGSGPKTLKVLSTSLGIALAAHLLSVPAASAEAAGGSQPKLVEWSTDAVKAYYDPNVDWNLLLPGEKKTEDDSKVGDTGASAAAPAGGSSGGAAVVHSGGGFGWDDLMLYHLLFNRGSVYSTSSWSGAYSVYDTRTHQPYQSRSYSPDTFLNRPVAGSTVRPPQTRSSSGSFSTSASRGTSSSPGEIGGRSSGFSSSGSSSHSSFGS